MPTRRIQRGPATGGQPPGFQNSPAFNELYVDGLTDEFVAGTGASGSTGAALVAVDPAQPVMRNLRLRVPIANVNAGFTLLAAIPGKKYRLAVDCSVVAVGAAAGAVTTVDILGTQATASVKLLSAAQAQLVRSAVLYAGIAGVTVLADGASFAQNDVNTPITIGITGSAITGATAIDVLLGYAIES